LMLWTEPVVSVDEVMVLLGFGVGIAWISDISTNLASHVRIHGFECLLGTHLLIMFYSLRELIYLSCKHVNFFSWMHTSFMGLESIVAPSFGWKPSSRLVALHLQYLAKRMVHQ
jgi:hypothetical protein